MKRLLCLTLSLLAAAALASCAKTSSTSTDKAPSGGTAENTTAHVHEDFDKDKYLEELLSSTEKQERSDEPFELKAPGELVCPDDDEEDSVLGDYHLSADGVKLYYEDGAYPTDMILMLEKYFTSFADGNFTDYSRCIYPSYLDEMDKYLQREYGYGIERSFSTQCANLAENAAGRFKVKYIKGTSKNPIQTRTQTPWDKKSDIYSKTEQISLKIRFNWSYFRPFFCKWAQLSRTKHESFLKIYTDTYCRPDSSARFDSTHV